MNGVALPDLGRAVNIRSREYEHYAQFTKKIRKGDVIWWYNLVVAEPSARAGAEVTRQRPANARVLIVDDQKDIHDDFAEMLLPRAAAAADELAASFLSREGPDHHLPDFELLHAMRGEEACELVEREARSGRPIAVAYIDIRMPPGIDGVATVRRIRRIDRAVEIVLMTAYTDASLADIVQDMELLHKLLYIRKPFAREEVQQITLALVEKWNLERELETRRRQLTITNRRLTAVLDSIGEGIAVCDDASRLLFANRCYQRLMAATEAEFEGAVPGGSGRAVGHADAPRPADGRRQPPHFRDGRRTGGAGGAGAVRRRGRGLTGTPVLSAAAARAR